MGSEGTFADLRRLANAFASLGDSAPPSGGAPAPSRSSTLRIAELGRRLGSTAVPLLLRELAQLDRRRREVARDVLATIATSGPVRARTIVALRELLPTCQSDDLKVCVLGLLAELGERAEARFVDTPAIQRRSALALAAQLHTLADVANAVDLMVKQLSGDDIVQMVELFVESTPVVARRVAAELAVRVDLAEAIRERVADAAMALAFVEATAAPHLDEPSPRAVRRVGRATIVAVLADRSGRLVVSACRKVTGERRWRRWAVLVGATGRIEDCLYDEDSTDAAQLVATLCTDGYHLTSSHDDDARAAIATAARATLAGGAALDSGYYRGRDLLELFDDHLARAGAGNPGRPGLRDPYATAIDRALQLLHTGELERAETILLRIPIQTAAARTQRPDLDAAVAALALARGRFADALDPLARAIAAEPRFALHHWNLAAAQHGLGNLPACHHALRQFLATTPSGAGLVPPGDAERIAIAHKLAAHIERASRLTGAPLPAHSTARARRAVRTKAPKKRPVASEPAR